MSDRIQLDDSDALRFRIDSQRHLCLVFFDILHLDGESLLQTPLVSRRRILEKVVRTVPGFVSPLPLGAACD